MFFGIFGRQNWTGRHPSFAAHEAGHVRSQADSDAERDSLLRPCGGCGAPAGTLCRSGTGLPSSVPCPERLAKEAGR